MVRRFKAGEVLTAEKLNELAETIETNQAVAAVAKTEAVAAAVVAVEGTARDIVAAEVAAEATVRASDDAAVSAKAQNDLSTQVGVLNKDVSEAKSLANQALTAANTVQTGNLILSKIPAYADETSAIAGGVPYEGLYRVGNAIHIVTTAPTTAPPPSDPVAPAPTSPSDVPEGWELALSDDFVRTARTGVESLDGAIWQHRSFGGPAHRGSSVWNNGLSHEATGSSVKVHAKKTDGVWYVDGFQQGKQDTDPTAWAYHPGYGEFQVEVRARFSHARAAGVGGYFLMWQADDVWGSEIDIMENPGEYKTQSQATMHQDFTGEYKLYGTLPDGTNRDKYSSAYKTIDLTQWNVWRCRRHYIVVGGVTYATIRIWINGEELTTPANWKNTRYLTKNMIFGAASFVAPQELAGWYTVPNSATPLDSWLELDYVRIHVPPAGASPTGGDGTTGTKSFSLSAEQPVIGTWNVILKQTSIASLSWVVIGPAPNYAFIDPPDQPAVINSPAAENAIAPKFTAAGQVLKYWETGNEAGAKYSKTTV